MQITKFARFAQNYALLLSEMKDDKKWREYRKRWLARFVTDPIAWSHDNNYSY